MARKRKHKQHDEHMDETWLIPYADLLTLLLALFIVLFAMSSVDAKKFEEIAESFNGVFTGDTSIMEYPNEIPVEEPSISNVNKKNDSNLLKENAELRALKVKIDAYINEKGLQENLKTTLTDEGLLISILNDVLFDSGSAHVKVEYEKVTQEVSNLLIMNPPRNIIISGHTDNVPMNNKEFSSNWHLSVIRAVNFMKILLENKNLDPRWFSAKGYGEFSPIATNDTTSGRKKNRRVEILILPNK